MYKILIDDKFYNKYEIYDTASLTKLYDNQEETNSDLSESEKWKKLQISTLKIFNHDIFDYDGTDVNVKYSPTKENQNIPGILIRDKIFGRKNNKNQYRVIPDDRRLPDFLVYLNEDTKFSKIKENIYLCFKFQNWNNKHPEGVISQRLGYVSCIQSFFEYTLYCKSLQISITQFTKKAKEAIKQKTHDEYLDIIMNKYNIEDRISGDNYHYCFSIDGSGTIDYDDAIGIKKDEHKISIYISNVSMWLETMNLWESFSERVSTIYLPNQKKTMLPVVLSDSICSLHKKDKKLVFSIDLYFNEDWTDIIDVKIKNCLIKLKHNFIYEEDKLLTNDMYNYMFEVMQKYSIKNNKICKINNSYDFVTFMMMYANMTISNNLIEHKTGIFRRLEYKMNQKNMSLYEYPDDLTNEEQRFLFTYQSQSAQYCDYNEHYQYNSYVHSKIQHYTHGTSPIRRLVDLLNSITLQDKMGLIKFSDAAHKFYDKWINKLDYINLTMRSIRKVQYNFNLLNTLERQQKEFFSKQTDFIERGIVFDEINFGNGLYQYHVYFEKLKFVCKYASSTKLSNYKRCNFNIYFFNQETTLKKKIKIKFVGDV